MKNTFDSSISWRQTMTQYFDIKNYFQIESKCPWRSHTVKTDFLLLLFASPINLLNNACLRHALCSFGVHKLHCTLHLKKESKNILSYVYSRLRRINKGGQWRNRKLWGVNKKWNKVNGTGSVFLFISILLCNLIAF